MNRKYILYVGEREAGLALAEVVEAEGGYVYLPHTMMEALGMYITYVPQVVVIDSRIGWASEVLAHLRSVDARPIVLLTEDYLYSETLFPLFAGISAAELNSYLDRVIGYVPRPLPM